MVRRAIHLIAIVAFFTIVSPCLGANHYISKDCANNGDGTEWSCAAGAGQAGAWNEYPATTSTYCDAGSYTWVRGDTYYVAGSDSAYGYACLRNTSGTGTITIKKASSSDHGSDTGWSASYGTKQASGTGFQIIVANVTVDGNYKYGFKIAKILNTNSDQANTYGIAIKNTEFTNASANKDDGLSLYVSATEGSTGSPNLLVENCWFYQMGGGAFYHVAGQYTVIQDCLFEENMRYNDATHKVVVRWNPSNNHILRRSIFKNNCGYTVTGIVEFGGDGAHSYIDIYNNIFYEETGACTGLSSGNRAIGGVSSNASPDHNHINVYSNTFYNLSQSGSANVCSTTFMSNCSNVNVKNNLWYSNAGLTEIGGTGVTTSNNWYHDNDNYTVGSETGAQTDGTGAPNAPTTFTLTAATNGGATLGSPYNADYAGNARSRYDMGAYEYITYPSMPLGSGATMSIGTGATMTVH